MTLADLRRLLLPDAGDFPTEFGLGWLTHFLPHYATNSYSRLHDRLAADLERFHEARGQRRVYIAPRGGAKTTFISKAYPLWAAVTGEEPLTLLLAETAEQAEAYLKAIKRELEANDRLARAYPSACGVGEVWRSDRITLRNGCTIVARGAGGRILGMTEGQNRPSLVIGDDMNSRGDAYSPTTRRRKTDWFLRDVLNVGSPRTNFLAVGTTIHREAIVCELGRNPGWVGETFRAVQRWPDRMDLWQRWEDLLTNLGDPDREANAAAFYAENRGDMDAGAELLWQDREPLLSLMRLRAEIGPAAFGTEKQSEPGVDGATEWPAAWFDRPEVWYSDPPAEWVCRVYALDPSKGSTGKVGDYQAHVRAGVAKGSGTIWVEADLRREDVTACVNRATREGASYQADRVAFEDNGTMGLLAPEISRAERELGVKVPWWTITQSQPKAMRIRRLTPYLSRGQIRIRNTPGGKLLVEQLRDWPGGLHDDGPDALATAVIQLEELLHGRGKR